MLRIGWEPPFGGYLEERVRYLVNQVYGEYPYRHYVDATVRYSHPWNDVTIGGEVLAGRDVFGKSFSRLSAFVRYGGDRHVHDDGASEDDSRSEDDSTADSGEAHPPNVELFVDAGANANRVRIDLEKGIPVTTTSVMIGPHFALGARREVSNNNDWGARLELDEVDGHCCWGQERSITGIAMAIISH